MIDPLLSVIVPVYNIENYIIDSVDSILNQSYKNLEVLLVDDGSTDKTGTICDDYGAKDSRVKVFHVQHGGVSYARNIALDNMHGEYVAFVDGDDYLKISPPAVIRRFHWTAWASAVRSPPAIC